MDLPQICESLQNEIIQLPGVTSVTLEKVFSSFFYKIA